LNVDLSCITESFKDAHLLKQHSVEDYAGVATEAKIPELTDLLSIPVKVYNMNQAVAAILQCHNICEELLNRASDSSTSSRLVLQMQVI
jgi:hypothetical protein